MFILLCLLLAAFAAVTLWRASAREAAAKAAYPPTGPFVTVEGLRIHAVVKGEGPDLVLIHGASGSLRDWTFAMVDRLAQEYRVIALDRPGFGWSHPLPRNAGAITDQARVLQKAAAELGAQKPIVLGHSYGGAVAAAWAVHHPDDIAALVMVAGVSHPWEGGIDTLYKVLGHPIGAALLVPLITAWVPDSYVQNAIASVFEPQQPPNGYDAHFGPAKTLRRNTLRVNARERIGLEEQIIALAPNYPALALPIEIVHGSADVTVGVAVHALPLQRDVPGTGLDVLEGVGHMPQHSHPDAIEQAIQRAADRAGLR